ncbi:hypothetical protein Poli38472_004458 [Pythium oligandrum]|uniref:Uncharacterized protein n=1 Tax=Pythium oligandrum TaxID=41045 RepID=A0A8K1CAC0_PYTOL|nr:hypothetical protein Poli38472_004458 [Pythium oligandrum]|eukprot:TMW59389.1 hypothetical protein Poli38472_004458 [Pythium oligandrum]
MSEEEAVWKREREATYEDLYRSGRAGVSPEGIAHARSYFYLKDKEYVCRPYVFPTESDAVYLVAAEIPADFARVCRELGDDLVGLIPRVSGTDDATGYVNDQATMHMTIFHTSHPDEMMPNAKSRKEDQIAKVHELASRFPPLPLKPHRIVLCSSGAIILLYEAIEDGVADPYTIDRLRKLAREEFSPMPKRMSKSLMHTTLARLMDPEISPEVIEKLHKRCEELTERLHHEHPSVVIQNLWFVEETHHYWARGPTTVISLGGASQ